MIDDPRKSDLLISMLKDSLPIQAGFTPYLSDALMSESPKITISKNRNVVHIFYAGDMVGIFCALDIGGGPVDKPVLAPAQPERLGRCNTDLATG